MVRESILSEIESTSLFDILVIGGGASGLGVALDAVSRGLKVVLVEKYDFGKGTSSKATKLLHGGVRYLAQGDIGLVTEALREREYVINQAPHLSRIQKFIIPFYSRWQGYYYLAGLKAYDFLSLNKSLGSSSMINKEETIKDLPNIKQDGLKGGIVYYDGQFDDTRLCIDLVTTIHQRNGLCINHCEFDKFTYDNNGIINGGVVHDVLADRRLTINAKVVVNATGVFAEQTMAKESEDTDIKIVPARGSHIVVSRDFLQSDNAIMIPKTTDGRVLFLIPWKTIVIIGTTDIQTKELTMEPKATDEEIDFMLTNTKDYLEKVPTKADILTTYAGLRPLAAPKADGHKSKEVSRSHKIVKSKGGLYSLLGGKWTTFRKMGEDTLDQIVKGGLVNDSPSTSIDIPIQNPESQIEEKNFIHPALPYSKNEIERICRDELVEKLDDVLARRTRCLFLNKQATMEVVPMVLEIMSKMKIKDKTWTENQKIEFNKILSSY